MISFVPSFGALHYKNTERMWDLLRFIIPSKPNRIEKGKNVLNEYLQRLSKDPSPVLW